MLSARSGKAGATLELARFTQSSGAALPEAVRAQTARAFINYMGCAIGGSVEPASRIAQSQADRFSGARHATALGTRMRLDALHAAWLNCLQSSIQTFDDTHLASVVHPTGPVASAVLALIEDRPECALDGESFIATLAIGIETACRIGAVLAAPHSGLHLGVFTTGIAGAIGAAAACGRLLGLDSQRQAWALGIAAAQAGGLRISHASMTGGLIPASGARIGLSAALLAADGFDCNEAGLEAPNGLLNVFSPGAQAEELVKGLGQHFEMAELAYKPYPCGIVIHPSIDGCLDIASQLRPGEDILSVALRVHPLALGLTGLRQPGNAMDAKVSLWHWSAAALARGRAGMDEATDAAVHDPRINSVRERIEARTDDSLTRDEAVVSVRLSSGRAVEVRVAHARGSRARPLTDEELAAKFTGLCTPVLGVPQTKDLLAWCQQIRVHAEGWPRDLSKTVQVPAYPPHKSERQ